MRYELRLVSFVERSTEVEQGWSELRDVLWLTLTSRAQTDAKDYTQETLELTARILGLNPEYQTGWGIRRRVLVEGLFPSL